MITEEQRQRRKQGIGGSDASAVLGLNHWKTNIDLWEIKTGRAEESPAGESARLGSELEAYVLERYQEATGNTVALYEDTIYHPAHPWMFAHLDGVIEGKNRILECKTAGCSAKKDWGEPGTDQVPKYYAVQVLHYLAVTGHEGADIAVLFKCSGKTNIYHIDRDEAIINYLIEQEHIFWHEHVLKDIAPEPNQKVRIRRVW